MSMYDREWRVSRSTPVGVYTLLGPFFILESRINSLPMFSYKKEHQLTSRTVLEA
jgi:hypothetical protein